MSLLAKLLVGLAGYALAILIAFYAYGQHQEVNTAKANAVAAQATYAEAAISAAAAAKVSLGQLQAANQVAAAAVAAERQAVSGRERKATTVIKQAAGPCLDQPAPPDVLKALQGPP